MTRQTDSDNSRWTLDDQIAFECALAHDDSEDWNALLVRDRSIAVSISASTDGARSRPALARAWLRARLEQAPSIKLAADTLSQSLATASQLLRVVAGLIGLGGATAALAYTGDAPINVSVFFGLFVLVPAVLACATLILFLLPRSVLEGWLDGPLFRFAKYLFTLASRFTQGFASRFLEAQGRSRAAEIAGVARQRLALHGNLLKWLAFTRLQSVALSLVVGALVALLTAVAFSDRAFGWQTTLDVSSEAVHGIARAFAAPWAWFFGEGSGYPSLADVEGSRIALKEGIRDLRTENLTAWWPFLALGIAVYGALPRVVFLFLGRMQLERVLRDCDFAHAAAERLFERLKPVAARFETEDGERAPRDGGPAELDQVVSLLERHSVVCLVAEGLNLGGQTDALRERLAEAWELPSGNVSIKQLDSENPALATEGTNPEDQYALLVESWMPPIKETERQIRTLRSAIGSRCLIRVVLLGMPDGATGGLTLSVDTERWKLWDSFARRLGDPYLLVEGFSR